MKIRNLSIIIIAHNEQFALKKCLHSISTMKLEDCEVICVDSGSMDKTQLVAKSFKSQIDNLNILHLTGYQNASIARNAGLRAATRSNIFFVDGDVELKEEFIFQALAKLNEKEADAAFGMLDDYEYSDKYKKLIKIRRNRTLIKHDENRYFCGGIFMITKSAANKVGFFDEQLVRCEDFDYALRLTKEHILKAIPVPMGKHHTIPYGNKTRMSNEIRNGLPFFYGALLRKNLINTAGCIAFVRKAGYIKGLCLDTLLILSIVWPLLLIPASLLVLLDIALGALKDQDIKYRLFSHYLVPIYALIGFITGPKRILNKNSLNKNSSPI